MKRLPESWLRELYGRVDLGQLVGSYMELQEKGGRLWGCCPFHHETKPSFTVNTQQGFYHCFGCGQHGNAVGFVMEMERLSFREACEFLAERVGLEMPAAVDDAQEQRSRQLADRVRAMNREAAAFYQRILHTGGGAAGADYLRSRHIDGSIAARYGLGYAPDSWHELRDHLASKGFRDREVAASGLVQEKNGSRYDAFRNRVMFPIISPQEEVIGFGGRVLGDGVPKYLNSPATPVFNKSRSLFNLNVAKGLRHKGELQELILMEGYMDVIGAARFGVLNTCATLGTALTAEQCRLIRRYVDRVRVCYDGDAAGIKAALRAIGLLEAAGLEARVVCLPDGLDPDEYLGAKGRDAFAARVQEALEPMAFRFRVARTGRDLSTPAGRTGYAEECVALLQEEKSALIREQYARVLAEQTGFRLEAILEDVGGRVRAPVSPAAPPPPAAGAEKRAENFAAACMAGRPELAAALAEILREDDFDNPANAAIYRYIAGNAGRGAEVSREELLEMLEGEAEKKHLHWLLGGLQRFQDDPSGLQIMLKSSVARLGMRRTRREIEQLKRELARTDDPGETDRLRRRIEKKGRKLHEWKRQAQTAGTKQ